MGGREPRGQIRALRHAEEAVQRPLPGLRKRENGAEELVVPERPDGVDTTYGNFPLPLPL